LTDGSNRRLADVIIRESNPLIDLQSLVLRNVDLRHGKACLMPGYKRKVPRVTISGLAVRARPVVKSIADTCKDIGVIGGAVYLGFQFLSRVFVALSEYLPIHWT